MGTGEREASPRAEAQEMVPEGGYVASKNGTKYHLPWCGSAKQIKEENKVWFATKEEAEAAGYTPAANCKGI
jgi:methylphosphotriester-DNA--protein-cysteine methyltransferase